MKGRYRKQPKERLSSGVRHYDEVNPLKFLQLPGKLLGYGKDSRHFDSFV